MSNMPNSFAENAIASYLSIYNYQTHSKQIELCKLDIYGSIRF